MKISRFLPLLFCMMFLLIFSIAHAQEDDVYFDPELDEVEGYNDNDSEDEYVDEDFEYRYVDKEIEREVKRIQRFRRTFHFVVVVSDPWLYYDDWGWTCRPRFRYRPYRAWRYDRWAGSSHYRHHYYRHHHQAHHYAPHHHHWNHWVNHNNYGPILYYGGYLGYHQPHHAPGGWHRTAGANKMGRSQRVGIAASKGAVRPSNNGKNPSTLAMVGKDGKTGRANKEVISIGRGSRPSKNTAQSKKPRKTPRTNPRTNPRTIRPRGSSGTASSNSVKPSKAPRSNKPRTSKPKTSGRPSYSPRPRTTPRRSNNPSPVSRSSRPKSSKSNYSSRSSSGRSSSGNRPSSSSRKRSTSKSPSPRKR